MTEFKSAYRITMINEGGYANNSHDRGGETWRGIARNFWQAWEGWPKVDSIKDQNPDNFKDVLKADIALEAMVLAFYKKEFWDCLSLTALECQQIANQLFDIGVNMGTGEAAKLLQLSINTFPGNAISVDEQAGPMTIAAANALDMMHLYDKISELRRERYEQIIASNPSQAIFRNAWFTRIKPFDTSIGQLS